MERGEAPIIGVPGAEPVVAAAESKSPAATMQLMEEVCERENLVRAWQRVRDNKGAPGVDGMTIDDAKSFLREHWPGIRSQLLAGTYQPQPVRRVEIPKPDGGALLPRASRQYFAASDEAKVWLLTFPRLQAQAAAPQLPTLPLRLSAPLTSAASA